MMLKNDRKKDGCEYVEGNLWGVDGTNFALTNSECAFNLFVAAGETKSWQNKHLPY